MAFFIEILNYPKSKRLVWQFETIRKFLISAFVAIIHPSHFTNGSFRDRGFSTTSLLDHIMGIFFFRANKKVRRISAWWVVATVQDAKIGRYTSVCEFPREPVRKFEDGVPVNLFYKEYPISEMMFFPGPIPTASGFNNLFKKPICKWACSRFVVAGLATASSYIGSVATGFLDFFFAIHAPLNSYPAHVDIITNMEAI